MTALTSDEILANFERYLGIIFPRINPNDANTLHFRLGKAFAQAMADLYTRNESVLTIVDPLRAGGADLDHIVSSRLLTRGLGSYAVGNLTFSINSPSTSDIIIPIGIRCKAGNYFFVTTEAGNISAGTLNTSIPAIAEVRGLSGNVTLRTIDVIYSSLPGVDSVINPLAFAGGTAEETDSELRQRFIDVTTLPGLATLGMIERRLVDLDYVSEAVVFNRGSGDIEVICDDSLGTEIDTDVTDELEIVIAVGCQASGAIAAIATPGGNIDPVIDPISLTSIDTAGSLIWVRPTEFVSSEDTFDIDYRTTSGTTATGSVTVPVGTHRGQMIAVELADETDRAVSIPTKVFTGIYNYDVHLGLGIENYLYNIPTNVSFSVVIDLVATDTPEIDLKANIQASIEAWLGDYQIGEEVQWSDLRVCSAIEYTAAIESSQKHVIQSTSRPFIGIDKITSFRISGKGQSIARDGETIVLENDEIARVGTIAVNVT